MGNADPLLCAVGVFLSTERRGEESVAYVLERPSEGTERRALGRTDEDATVQHDGAGGRGSGG